MFFSKIFLLTKFWQFLTKYTIIFSWKCLPLNAERLGHKEKTIALLEWLKVTWGGWEKGPNQGQQKNEQCHCKSAFFIWALIEHSKLWIFFSPKNLGTSWKCGRQNSPKHGYLTNVYWRKFFFQDSLSQVVSRFFKEIPTIFAIFTHFIASEMLLNST